MVFHISLLHNHSRSGNKGAMSGLYSHAWANLPYRSENSARVIPHPQHSVPRNLLKRQVVSPLKMPSVGNEYSIAGKSNRRKSLLIVSNRVAVCIGEASYKDHNEVDESPDAASAASQQLCYACACLAYIEAVYSKATEEKA